MASQPDQSQPLTSPIAILLSLATVILACCAWFWSRGYGYSPATGDFPLLAALIRADPQLFAKDLVLGNIDVVGRHYWNLLLLSLSGWFSYYWLLFALYLGTCCLTLSGIYALAKELGNGSWGAGVAALFLVLGHTHRFFPGYSPLMGFGTFYEHQLSAAMIVWALYLAIKGRPVLPFVIVGLSLYLHVLQGLQAGLVLGIFYLWRALTSGPERVARLRRLALAGGLALLVGLPELLPLLAQFSGMATPAVVAGPPALSGRDFVEIIGHLRTGHHFIPLKYPLTAYQATICLLAAMAAAWAWLPRSPSVKRCLQIVTVLVGVMLVFLPLAETGPFVMLLHMARSCKFIWALGMALMGALAANLLACGPWVLRPVALVLLLLWWAPPLWGLALVLLLLLMAFYRPGQAWALIVAALGALAATSLLTPPWQAGLKPLLLAVKHQPILYWISGGVAILAGLLPFLARGASRVVVVVLCLVVAFGLAWNKPVKVDRPPPRLPAVYSWLAQNTQPGEVVLLPPTEEFRDFPYSVRRPMFATLLYHPVLPDLVKEWYHRLNLLSGGQLAAQRAALVAVRWRSVYEDTDAIIAQGFAKLSAEQLRAIGRQYDLRYCLRRKGHNPGLPVAFAGDGYEVLRLR